MASALALLQKQDDAGHQVQRRKARTVACDEAEKANRSVSSPRALAEYHVSKRSRIGQGVLRGIESVSVSESIAYPVHYQAANSRLSWRWMTRTRWSRFLLRVRVSKREREREGERDRHSERGGEAIRCRPLRGAALQTKPRTSR